MCPVFESLTLQSKLIKVVFNFCYDNLLYQGKQGIPKDLGQDSKYGPCTTNFLSTR